jgi:hypothetical protein
MNYNDGLTAATGLTDTAVISVGVAITATAAGLGTMVNIITLFI